MKIKGSNKADDLVGTSDDDTILGLGGDDTIKVKGGSDTVDAGKGDDTVIVTAGAESSEIDLGKGNDSAEIKESNKSNQTFTIDGGKGDDAVNFALGQDGYTITENGDGAYTVVDANGNSYELTSISNLTFNGIPFTPANPTNDAPVVSNQIADQNATATTAYTFQVAANAFTDPDGDTLTYSATLADGTALPSWLNFNATTRTFSGTPTASNIGAVAVRVTASDGSLSTFDDFNITVAAAGGGGGPVFVNSYGDLEHQHLNGMGQPDGLYAGKGNPANGFALSVNDQAGIELGLDVRYKNSAAEVAPDTGSTNTWHVDAANLNNLRFAYSAAADQGLSNYNVRLSIDTDGSAGQNFYQLDLGADQGGNNYPNNGNSAFDWFNVGQPKITDDGGDAAGTVTQNIQALQWYQQQGLEAGDEFQIKLEAFQQGAVMAQSEITIKINGHTERALEDFNGNSDMVLTNIGGDSYGNVVLNPGDGTATITQTNDDPVDGAGPFTRFDHYRTDNPDVVTTSVDININAADIGNGEGFAYSVAANKTTDVHMRDFVFNVANNGTGVKVGASTGAGTTPPDLSGDPNAKSLADGWYTFQHTMYENASHDLEVKLEVIDKDTGATVFTQILTDATDDFSTFGGNRYGWFAEIDVNEGLQIDNWALAAQYF